MAVSDSTLPGYVLHLSATFTSFRIISAGSSAVVSNAAHFVAFWFQAAVDRLVSNPNRTVQLVPWIQAVLYHHTAYLMSAPGVQPVLANLFQVREGFEASGWGGVECPWSDTRHMSFHVFTNVCGDQARSLPVWATCI